MPWERISGGTIRYTRYYTTHLDALKISSLTGILSSAVVCVLLLIEPKKYDFEIVFSDRGIKYQVLISCAFCYLLNEKKKKGKKKCV